MATIGELVVELKAETAQLRADLRKSQGQLRQSAGRMNRSLQGIQRNVRGLQTAFRVLAGSAVLGFVARQFDQMVDAQDRAGKSAERLGIAVDQLTALQFAAQQAGIAVNTFEMALQRMIRRTAEARQGTGEALGALGELGLDPTRLAALSPDRQLNAIADALRSVQSESDQVRLAFKLFDSEGVALLQMLKGGSVEIEKFKQQARALGIVVDQDAAEAARKWRDATGELHSAWTGLQRTLGEPTIPTVTEWVRNSTQAMTQLRAAVDGAEGAWGRYFERISIIPSGPAAAEQFRAAAGLPGKPTDPEAQRRLGNLTARRGPGVTAGGGATTGADFAAAQGARIVLLESERKAVAALAKEELQHVQNLQLDASLQAQADTLRADATKQAEALTTQTQSLYEAELRHVEALKLDVTAQEEATRIRQEQAEAMERATSHAQAFSSIAAGAFSAAIVSGRSLTDVLRQMVLQMIAATLYAETFAAIMSAVTGNPYQAVGSPFRALGIERSGGGSSGAGTSSRSAVMQVSDWRRRGGRF